MDRRGFLGLLAGAAAALGLGVSRETRQKDVPKLWRMQQGEWKPIPLGDLRPNLANPRSYRAGEELRAGDMVTIRWDGVNGELYRCGQMEPLAGMASADALPGKTVALFATGGYR